MIFLLYLLALTPLFYSDSGFYPSTNSKSIFIEILLTLVAVLFFIRFLKDQDFRKKISLRVNAVLRNKIFISLSAYLFFYILSGILAVDKFTAFFGTAVREQGVIEMVFFFSLFLFMALLFKKRDWLWFFKITIFSSTILFLYQLVQFFQGTARPSALVTNPIFLACYYLFAIMAAGIIYVDAKKTDEEENLPRGDFRNSVIIKTLASSKGVWPIVALVVIFTSLVGIFLAESRGVIAGLVAGVFAILLTVLFFSKGRTKRFTAFVFIALIIGGGLFFLTRHSVVWSKISGVNRIATFSYNDESFGGRAYAVKAALRSIDLSQNGYKKFFFGWGPENFSVALDTHYDPKSYFEYQYFVFDRAHDKILGVLVASGLFGLLAYLAIWFFVFRAFLAKNFGDSGLLFRSLLIFFAVAYCVQNIFIFDSLITYTAFFSFLGFVVFLEEEQKRLSPDNPIKDAWVAFFSGTLALFFVTAFIFWSIIPFIQMEVYLQNANQPDKVLKTNFIFSPFSPTPKRESSGLSVYEKYFYPILEFNFVQSVIRRDLLLNLVNAETNKRSLLVEGIVKMEDLLEYKRFDSRNFILLAIADAHEAEIKGDPSFLKKAEENYKKALALSPKKQWIQYAYGSFFLNQGDVDRALEVYKYALDLNDQAPISHFYFSLGLMAKGEENYAEALDHMEIFLSDDNIKRIKNETPNPDLGFKQSRGIYKKFLPYYYGKQDKARILKVITRLIDIDPSQAMVYGEVADMIKQTGQIPEVIFQR